MLVHPGSHARSRAILPVLAGLTLTLAACGPALIAVGIGSAGGGGGSAAPPPGPAVTGFALYLDSNFDGTVNAGDEVVVRFSETMQIGQPLVGDFVLPVAGDSLGAATFGAIPDRPDAVRIVLGAGAALKTRMRFVEGRGTARSPSGIDVSGAVDAARLSSSATGVAPRNTRAVDVLPGYVEDTAQQLSAAGGGGTLALAGFDVDQDGWTDLIAAGGSYLHLHLNRQPGFMDPPSQVLDAASSWTSVVVADLDADGLAELVAGSATAGIRRWDWNPGTAAFDAAATPLLDASQLDGSITQLAVGDVDGDGRADLVFGDGQGLWTILQPGFTATAARTGAAQSGLTGIAAADFDRDGDVDVVGCGAAGITFWANPGAGMFGGSSSLDATAARSLAVGDLDRNGTLDLVVGRDGPNAVLRNDTPRAGTPAFTPQAAFGAGVTRAVVLVDVDRDGFLDLVTGNGESGAGEADELWLNGTGDSAAIAFEDSGFRFSDEASSAILGLDVDHQDDVDLVFASSDAGEPTVIWRSSLAGGLGRPLAESDLESTVFGQEESRYVALGDIDGDGALDAVAANRSLGVRVYRNLGTGAFGPVEQLIPTVAGIEVQFVGLADLDRDGDLDLVMARKTTPLSPAPNAVWLWDAATASFVVSQEDLGAATSQAVAIADLNGDGYPDLVFATDSPREPSEVFLNVNGAFPSTPDALFDADFATPGITVGDFDRDGDIDIVTANRAQTATPSNVQFATNHLWLNDGNGAFVRGADVGPEERESVGVATADVDRDGDLDLVFANRRDQSTQSGEDQVYRNDGAGGFTLAQSFGRADEVSQELTLADFDGDGWVDVVIANRIDNFDKTTIRINDRTGRFGTTVGDLTLFDTRGASSGDLDRDGDTDLVLALVREESARAILIR